MFDFTNQTKQFEQLAARIKEMNDFWVNAVMDTWKSFYSSKK
jgi:hypothetical protein